MLGEMYNETQKECSAVPHNWNAESQNQEQCGMGT